MFYKKRLNNYRTLSPVLRSEPTCGLNDGVLECETQLESILKDPHIFERKPDTWSKGRPVYWGGRSPLESEWLMVNDGVSGWGVYQNSLPKGDIGDARKNNAVILGGKATLAPTEAQGQSDRLGVTTWRCTNNVYLMMTFKFL